MACFLFMYPISAVVYFVFLIRCSTILSDFSLEKKYVGVRT